MDLSQDQRWQCNMHDETVNRDMGIVWHSLRRTQDHADEQTDDEHGYIGHELTQLGL